MPQMDACERNCFEAPGPFSALWDPHHFPMVADPESWQAQLGSEEALLGHVAGGFLVPLRTNAPGVYDLEVRVSWSDAEVGVDEREAGRVLATSGPFLFRSSGLVCFGGLEFLESMPVPEVGTLGILPGDYECRIHLVDWAEEPGCLDEEGLKSQEALPDFIVLLNPVRPGFCPEVSLQTFR